MNWPLAFVLTVTLETLVVFLFFRKDTPLSRILIAGVLANAVTHPFVWFLFPRLATTYGTYILMAEIFAFVIEIPIIFLIIRPKPWYMSIAASAAANGVSYGVGILLYAYIL